MFLPVTRPDCAGALNQLTEMISTILADAAGELMPRDADIPALEAAVPPNLRNLLRHKKVCRAVKALYQLPYIDRLRVYEAFQNDISFHCHIRDEKYQLSRLSGLPKAGGEVLKTICTELYKLASAGVPAQGPAKGTGFSSQLLREQFKKVNRSFGRVCPICIRENLFDAGEGEGDHYFPKFKYPALALHPDNLLPVCGSCNSPGIKGTKDPVDSRDAGAGELCTVFLPYLRAAWDEVELDVDAHCRIMMRPKPGSGGWTARRIENMDRLYRLCERWSSVLESVQNDVWEDARQQCAGCGSRKEKLDTLRRILSGTASSTRTRTEFIKGVYCAWLLKKSDRELEGMLLYSTLDFPEDAPGA